MANYPKRPCKYCGSPNVTYQLIKTGEKSFSGKGTATITKKRAWWKNVIYFFTGMWFMFFFPRKKKAPVRMNQKIVERQTIGFCKDCGRSWVVKK